MKLEHDCSIEELIEALEACHGIIGSAATYIREKWHLKVSRRWIETKIKVWNMEEFVKDCRIRGVERGLTKMISKAIDEGDPKAIGFILSKYGHHCDFLEAKETNGLEVNKGDISGFYGHMQAEYAREDSEAVQETD